MNRYYSSKWTIDRRIPIAVIVAIIMQIAGALIWATQLDARVNRIEEQSLHSAAFNERFARMEERLDNVKQDTNALKQLLAHLTEKLLRP